MRDMWLGCALQVLCGECSEAEQGQNWLAGPRVAQSLAAENSCAMGRGFSHMRRTNQKEDDLLGTALLKGTCCQALLVSKSTANYVLQIKGPMVSADAACETQSTLRAQGRHRTQDARDMDVKCSSKTAADGWWQGAAAALLCDLSPVQVVNEVPHVAGQDDAVLPHVPVIPKHAHWNVGRHFRKLPQNIVKCPSPEGRERGRWVGTSFC